MEHLTFTESPHAYFWHDVEYPSVTQILEEWVLSGWNYVNRRSGQAIAQDVFEGAGDDGSFVHGVCAGILAGRIGELKWGAIPEKLQNPVKQFMVWGRQAGIKEVLEIEFQMYSQEFQFAGTCDFIYKDTKGRVHIVDIKTSPDYKMAVAQLAAYAHMYKKITKYRGEIYASVLYLPKKKGKYKHKEFTGAELTGKGGGWSYFLSRRNSWIWEKENL